MVVIYLQGLLIGKHIDFSHHAVSRTALAFAACLKTMLILLQLAAEL